MKLSHTTIEVTDSYAYHSEKIQDHSIENTLIKGSKRHDNNGGQTASLNVT